LPGQTEREHILARYLLPFGLPMRALSALAEAFETASPALMRQFCESLKRQIVVGPKLNSDMRREAGVERILAAVPPPPDLGQPRLGTRLGREPALAVLPWPLPRAGDVTEDIPDSNVVSMRR